MQLLGGVKPEPEKKAGIGGWLLCLCILLTMLLPFALASGIYTAIRKIQAGETSVNIMGMLILNGALMAFSVIAGIFLWLRKSYGVMVAKIFLFIFTGINFTIIISNTLFELLKGETEMMQVFSSVLYQAFISVIVPILLVIYLFKSERVKNTFPVPASRNK